MSDVVSIQEQARRSFFQWHVLLLMKKKPSSPVFCGEHKQPAQR